MREKRSAQNWWWREKSSGYNYIEEKQPKSSSLSNALYMTSSNLDKIRVFIRNVSCTKCPKNRPFLRSQITVWLYKVWVCLSIKTKGFSKFTLVDHQMFKVRVSLYFKTNFAKRPLKVDHRWSPDVLILLIGWAAAWENLQWAFNPFFTPGEKHWFVFSNKYVIVGEVHL